MVYSEGFDQFHAYDTKRETKRETRRDAIRKWGREALRGSRAHCEKHSVCVCVCVDVLEYVDFTCCGWPHAHTT